MTGPARKVWIFIVMLTEQLLWVLGSPFEGQSGVTYSRCFFTKLHAWLLMFITSICWVAACNHVQSQFLLEAGRPCGVRGRGEELFHQLPRVGEEGHFQCFFPPSDCWVSGPVISI